MDSRALVETALRVLIAWTAGRQPDASDIESLYQYASPAWLDLPADQVACELVRRECGRLLEESRQDREQAATLMKTA